MTWKNFCFNSIENDYFNYFRFSETEINKLCTVKCVLRNLFIYNLCYVHGKYIQKMVDSGFYYMS